jgi:hypothetical protein
MSAKNGIVILKNKNHNGDYEYRLNHCGNIEELYSNNFEYVRDYIRNNFTQVPVNYSFERAIENAINLARKIVRNYTDSENIGYMEYGIIKYNNLEDKYFNECI